MDQERQNTEPVEASEATTDATENNAESTEQSDAGSPDNA